MAVCIASIPLEAGVSPIILASTTGLGLSAAYLAAIIRAVEHQRSLIAGHVEEKITNRLRELAISDWSFSEEYFKTRLEQEIGRANRYGLKARHCSARPARSERGSASRGCRPRFPRRRR